MLEQQEQKKIIDYLEKKGYYVIKLIKTNKNGIPDLLVLGKGETFFIEVKQKKGKQSEIQKFRQKEITELGYKSYCYYGYNDFIMKTYLNEQKEKILDFARDLKITGEITQEDLEDTYFALFVAK